VTTEGFSLMSVLAGEGFKDVRGKMEDGRRKKVNKNKKKREERIEVRK
jgi:hypothetical protein